MTLTPKLLRAIEDAALRAGALSVRVRKTTPYDIEVLVELPDEDPVVSLATLHKVRRAVHDVPVEPVDGHPVTVLVVTTRSPLKDVKTPEERFAERMRERRSR